MTHSALGTIYLLVALLAAGVPSGADPQEPRAAVMNGTCHRFIMSGSDATKICEGKVVNMAYPDGHSSFMFLIKDKALISFYGMDSEAIGNKATIKIEKMTINLLMGTQSTGGAANGVCTYTNPYAGPSLVECDVYSEGQQFRATFVSDGNEPSIIMGGD